MWGGKLLVYKKKNNNYRKWNINKQQDKLRRKYLRFKYVA